MGKKRISPFMPGDEVKLWTLLRPVMQGKNSGFLCRCKCGKEGVVTTWALMNGQSNGCGCVRTKHGHSSAGGSPEYGTWKSMKARCGDPKHPAYRNYGGRGITVCNEWRDDFGAFLADMGNKPSQKHELDRIDNNSGYCKANCRWVTRSENNLNRRNNQTVTYRGETLTHSEWAKRMGCSQQAMSARFKRWPLERALSERPAKGGRRAGE
jgi:hypothetical protein